MASPTNSGGNNIVPVNFGRAPEVVASHAPRQPLVRIHLLGSLRATTYLGDDILPRGRKARAVLGYLCLSAGERVARSRLGSLLWERVQDRQARASFRQALRELSAAMGPLAGELIDSTLDTVRLEPGLCWIDALAVQSSEPLPPHTYRSDLASLCTGELLEDLSGITSAFDQWLLAERTRFTERLSSRASCNNLVNRRLLRTGALHWPDESSLSTQHTKVRLAS
jgi:DNA-binding SARP family transcriptional activator